MEYKPRKKSIIGETIGEKTIEELIEEGRICITCYTEEHLCKECI